MTGQKWRRDLNANKVCVQTTKESSWHKKRSNPSMSELLVTQHGAREN